jgi:hypothetical protein
VSAERTEGYVIRWYGILEPRYYRRENMPGVLAQADVMSLLEASVALRQAPLSVTNAEIVRVRRVRGADRWEPLDGDVRVVNGEGNVVWAGGRNDYVAQRRIPGEPRWEVVEDA